ncbi:MAG TPA: YidB family protein [Casimicrobiaceae bacterium]|nr:YidB family protein [Casimicrobiaceae bacterium]
MGLLDSLLGSLMGGTSAQGQSPLLAAALQMIQQNGGLPGIIGKFQQGGYGQQMGSWIGTGANMPITGSQLQEILGSGSIGQIAQQLGLSHGDASSGLAQVLPQLIDGLTPKGQVPSDHADLLQQALTALTTRRG